MVLANKKVLERIGVAEAAAVTKPDGTNGRSRRTMMPKKIWLVDRLCK